MLSERSTSRRWFLDLAKLKKWCKDTKTAKAAAAAGMSRGTLYLIVTGKRDITITTFLRLAKAMGCEPAHLFKSERCCPRCGGKVWLNHWQKWVCEASCYHKQKSSPRNQTIDAGGQRR